MNDLVVSVVPSVELVHGQPMVSSLTVAEHFRKRHLHVLRDVRDLDCSAAFRQSNFGSANYTDAQGKPRESVRMTRDGFVFLVMGYTGAAAARVKEAYIQRFNEMEARYKVSASELDYYRRRERELIGLQRAHIRLLRQHVRVLKHVAAPRAIVPVPSNQLNLFGGAA